MVMVMVMVVNLNLLTNEIKGETIQKHMKNHHKSS
jgi:hypothetical protein